MGLKKFWHPEGSWCDFFPPLFRRSVVPGPSVQKVPGQFSFSPLSSLLPDSQRGPGAGGGRRGRRDCGSQPERGRARAPSPGIRAHGFPTPTRINQHPKPESQSPSSTKCFNVGYAISHQFGSQSPPPPFGCLHLPLNSSGLSTSYRISPTREFHYNSAKKGSWPLCLNLPTAANLQVGSRL